MQIHCISSSQPDDTLYWHLGWLYNLHANADILKVDYVIGNANSWTSARALCYGAMIATRHNGTWNTAVAKNIITPEDPDAFVDCMWGIILTSDDNVWARIKNPHNSEVQGKFFIDAHNFVNTNSRPTPQTTAPSNIQLEVSLRTL